MVLVPIILLLFLTVSGKTTQAAGEECPHLQHKNRTKYHLNALKAGQNYHGDKSLPDLILNEFSVVYTDRALNSMSDTYIQIHRELKQVLKERITRTTRYGYPGAGRTRWRQYFDSSRRMGIRC